MEYCSRDRKGQEKKLFSPAANLVGEKELEQSNTNDFDNCIWEFSFGI